MFSMQPLKLMIFLQMLLRPIWLRHLFDFKQVNEKNITISRMS